MVQKNEMDKEAKSLDPVVKRAGGNMKQCKRNGQLEKDRFGDQCREERKLAREVP